MSLFDRFMITAIEIVTTPVNKTLDAIDRLTGTPPEDCFDHAVKRDVFGDSFLRMLDPVDDRVDKAALKQAAGLEYGDIVAVDRDLYTHYGVYAGAGTVIHYTSEESDVDGSNTIQETSFARFLRGEGHFAVLVFPDRPGEPQTVPLEPSLAPRQSIELLLESLAAGRRSDYRLHSPEETVERARSRLGEDEYSWHSNNCEHFAIWCKTGVSESRQAQALLKGLGHLLFDDGVPPLANTSR